MSESINNDLERFPHSPKDGDRYTDKSGCEWEWISHDYDDQGHWTVAKGMKT